MTGVTTLKSRRGQIKSRITRHKNFLATQGESPDIDELQVKSDALSEHFKTLYAIHEELLEEDPTNQENHNIELEKMEEDYYKLLADSRKLIRKAQEIINTTSNTNSSRGSTPANTNQFTVALPRMKLPEIALPKFDGSIEKWQSFRDKFESRIGNNPDIPPIDKIQYLQSSLTDKAARAVENIETTEANYYLMWDILTKKYDNTRKAILRHISILMSIPRLEKDTPQALDELIDTFRQHLRALKALNQSIEHWDSIIIWMLLSKVGEHTRYQWEITLPDNKMPSHSTLIEFLEKRGCCSDYSTSTAKKPNRDQKTAQKPRRQALVTTSNKTTTPPKTTNDTQPSSTPSTASSSSSSTNPTVNSHPCPICQNAHSVYKCNAFLSASIDQRKELAKKASLCLNCLGKGHVIKDCKGGACRTCGQKHHTFLHSDANQAAATDTLIYILHQNKSDVPCRAIIDTGSSTNFITEELATTLRLRKKECHIPIGALNGLSTVAGHWVTATIKSFNNAYQKSVDFLIVPRITSNTPDQQINRQIINIPANIQLADPEFHKPAPVQVLLGSGLSLSLLCVGQVKLSGHRQPELYLQKTLLGWVIGGSLPHPYNRKSSICHLASLQNDISRFWELEECSKAKHSSIEEIACEEHFKKHVTRNPDGRYVVALPFNDKKEQLGTSRGMALKRLQGLERRFSRDPDLQHQYQTVIQEYIELGHMVKINGEPTDGFYLPHHAVIKETSLTTKVRVVFDGSAASSTGISLNDALMVGPVIQDDLFALVIWFRMPNYLVTGDIEKMFRQVLIRDEDQKYLRILWREEDGTISTYQLTTDTFGLGPASFLAIRCIHQLADDEQEKYPRASSSLKRRLYVDDFLDGAETIEEAVQLRDEVIGLLKAGGFNLRQCASNSPEVLQGLPDCRINRQLQDKNDPNLKTLGMHWNSQQDLIIYTVKPIITPSTTTKRIIFSEIAKIFDPLGLLNPVIVTTKLLMQELWRLKLDWDESLPLDVHTRWTTFVSQLPALNDIAFERRMLQEQSTNVQLHGFCDASQKAYGACIYLRSTNQLGHTRVRLLCAKSRVAPIKTTQTIPRLELCAAVLLASLYTTVMSAINITIDQSHFWTDSMIALHWINTSPHLLKTFVANRVSDVQTKTNKSEWRHVPTKDNPADLLSRGLLPKELNKATIWRSGPDWLACGSEEWPEQQLPNNTEVPEARKLTCLVTTTADDSLLLRYSSFTKLRRVIAFCLRFRLSNRNKGPLTALELKASSIKIIKLVQQCTFQAELDCLSRNKPISTKSRLLSLNPFIDNEGILRVGGRLQQSNYTYQQKHPILLPKSHHVTTLIIEHEHIKNLHGGVQSTLCTLRQQYWPIDGRNQVRKVIRSCVRCAKVNPSPVEYTMGSLPKVRVTEARPFSNVGVDYCGPFYIKEKRYRNKNKIKVYVAIFVCLAVKAVHIEVVSDLTTEAFLAALRRFISRRGRCDSIHSDNGTNFVGANNELKDLQTLLASEQHNKEVHDYLAEKGITWKFIPPQSPHVGGIWEAAVKTFKHHLKRVIGSELFTFEQLSTLTTEIEAILNSRPLTPMSTDPNDLTPLTPSHFLIGDILTGLPEQGLLATPSNRLSTWQHIQKVKQDFWTRWHKEYINELNIRHKWKKGEHPIKEGSIVIIRDDNAPTLQWRLGKVIEAHPGPDGVIRTVRVKTATGQLDRNVKRLAPLPVTNEL